jgi:hypothetical protein
MLSEQRLEQELADLRAAVVCAKDSKQAQEEHYLRQIIKVGHAWHTAITPHCQLDAVG